MIIKWLKLKLKNKLKFFFEAELRLTIENELRSEFKKIYFDLRWEEFINDKSCHKMVYSLNKEIAINLYKDNYLSHLIYFNQFEAETVDFLNSNLKKGYSFIDIGANIGYFTLLAANILSNNGMVLSFEPTKETYSRLSENIIYNDYKNIEAFDCAISDYNGSANFNVSSDGHDAFNSFSLPFEGIYTQEIVEVKTLDSFYQKLEKFKNKICIKIDVEGWEYNAIKGAKRILTELDPILIIEFNDANTKNSPFKCKDVYSLLSSYGYKMYALVDNKLIPKENEDYFDYQNLVAQKS